MGPVQVVSEAQLQGWMRSIAVNNWWGGFMAGCGLATGMWAYAVWFK